MRREKGESLAHRHLQNVMNIFFFVTHIQDGAFVTRAAAFFANQLNVREKTHFHRHGAVTLASLAAPSGNIEGKMSGCESALLGFRRGGKNFANRIERL